MNYITICKHCGLTTLARVSENQRIFMCDDSSPHQPHKHESPAEGLRLRLRGRGGAVLA